jgi:hypothetical protein
LIHVRDVSRIIPEDLEVPEPLAKKRFEGGLYAVHTSYPINFDEWPVAYRWVGSNGAFDYDRREPLGMEAAWKSTSIISMNMG